MTDASLIDHEPQPDAPRSQPEPTTRWIRARAIATRHWLFLVVFGIGFALRVTTQIAYRPALLFIDSYRYLDLLDTLDPTKSQTIGYDFLVLWPVLKVGNLFVVALVQHALGLAMGVGIYVLCVRYGVPRWLAAAAAAPLLLDAYQLQIEQNIMSEAIFEALLVGAMLALLWHRRPTSRALVIGGVLLGLAVPVRIVALPLVVPAMIFAFVSGPGGARRLGRTAIVAVAFLVPLAGYMTYYRSQTGAFGLTTTDAHATFGRAAQIADCDTLSLTPVERRLCPREPLGHRRGVNYYAHHYPVRRLSGVSDEPRLNEVLRDFARHVFRQQPLDLAHAVATDFVKGFRWRHANAHNDVPVERWQFQTHWVFNEYGPLAATREFGGGPPTIVKPLASFLRSYQLTVGYTPGPVLAVAFIGGILGGCGLHCARRSRLRAVCWLPTLCGIGVVLTADLFEFSWRYQMPMLVFAPIAGALGFTAIFRDPDATFPAASRSRAGSLASRSTSPPLGDVMAEFFGYAVDKRLAPFWLPFGLRPSKDGIVITDDGMFRATFGFVRLETPLTNIDEAHVTRNYRWWTAAGVRGSMVDDGLTLGTNRRAGVCVHFREPVPSLLRRKGHSAITVTVADLDGLVRRLER